MNIIGDVEYCDRFRFILLFEIQSTTNIDLHPPHTGKEEFPCDFSIGPEDPLYQLTVIHLEAIIELFFYYCPIICRDDLREELFLHQSHLFMQVIHLHFEFKVDCLGIKHYILFQQSRDEVDHDESYQDLRIVIIVERVRGQVGQYFQEIRLGDVFPQLQELQANQGKVIYMNGPTLLHDDVFSSQEEILNPTMHEDEIHECLG